MNKASRVANTNELGANYRNCVLEIRQKCTLLAFQRHSKKQDWNAKKDCDGTNNEPLVLDPTNEQKSSTYIPGRSRGKNANNPTLSHRTNVLVS